VKECLLADYFSLRANKIIHTEFGEQIAIAPLEGEPLNKGILTFTQAEKSTSGGVALNCREKPIKEALFGVELSKCINRKMKKFNVDIFNRLI
jgi:hypothetical protein